jgi:hypothetical protein
MVCSCAVQIAALVSEWSWAIYIYIFSLVGVLIHNWLHYLCVIVYWSSLSTDDFLSFLTVNQVHLFIVLFFIYNLLYFIVVSFVKRNNTWFITRNHHASQQINKVFVIVNLSPVSEGSNPDIENRDNKQSTMYSSDTPLAIEQVRRSLRLLEPMTQRENRFPS